MRELTGYLLAPDGTPLQGTLTFVALQSVPVDMPIGASTAATLDEAGRYRVEAKAGYYTIHYAPPRGQGRLLGRIVVTDGPPADVLTLIGAPNLVPPDAQVVLDGILDIADTARQAEQTAITQAGIATGAAGEALQSEQAAAASAQNAANDRQTVGNDRTAVSTMRGETLGFRNAAEGFRDTARDYRNETQILHDDTLGGLVDYAAATARNATALTALQALFLEHTWS